METKTVKRLTEREKKVIEEMYAAGHEYDEIAKAIWRAPQTICNYLDKAGLRPIVRRGSRTQNKKTDKCPHCGKTGQPKGARFCYHCGQDIRSESVILAERARKLLQVVQFLPENMKVETSDTVQAIIRYLEKQS